MAYARYMNRVVKFTCPEPCGRKLGLHVGQNRYPVWWCARHPEIGLTYADFIQLLWERSRIRPPRGVPRS